MLRCSCQVSFSSCFDSTTDPAEHVCFVSPEGQIYFRCSWSNTVEAPLPPEELPYASIRTRVRHPIGKLHILRASPLLNEPPPLMDQKDAAGGLTLRHGQGALDGPPVGELSLNLL